VRRLFALFFATLSGLYLLIWGPMIGPLDPVPILDEGVALAIFISSMASLGIDVRRFVPFLRSRHSRRGGPAPAGKKPGPVVDV